MSQFEDEEEDNRFFLFLGEHPRAVGLLILLFSFVPLLINFVSIKISGFYSEELNLIAPVCFMIGFWVLLAGRDPLNEDGTGTLWWKIGSNTFGAIGLGVSAYIYFF